MTAPAPARTVAPEPERDEPLAKVALWLAIVGVCTFSLIPATVALYLARKAEERIVDSRGKIGGQRTVERAQRIGHIGVALGIVALLVLFVYVQRSGFEKVQHTFFNWKFLKGSFPSVLRGFWLNVKLFMVAEVCVLVWALIVTLARIAPGTAFAPVRWLAIIYIDIFRGMPLILTVAMVGFGLPLIGIKFSNDNGFNLFCYGVLALTLVYGAYVCEVYRAGIDGVHWSQAAAARSLGLSYPRTMRYVIVPQAVRRVIPPLLNDFIGLQKDTALVSVLGLLEAFNRARIYNGTHFTLSAYTGVAICFIVVTIPLARFTDHLIERDRRRTGAQG